MLANHAEDEEIKDKFEQISERHQKHFDSLYKQLG
jgi:rubrerythrin